MLVFIASVGSAVAEDVASEEISVFQDVEKIAVDEQTAPVEQTEDDALLADAEDESGDSSGQTSCSVKIEVLDKNIKVGDEFRVKITATNLGPNDAYDAQVGVSFADLQGNIDGSFILIDDGEYDITEADGGYVIGFGDIINGESTSIILTFLATESGEKIIVADIGGDNIEENDLVFANATISVADNGNNYNSTDKHKSAAKTMPATGNPLALLALAVFAIVGICLDLSDVLDNNGCKGEDEQGQSCKQDENAQYFFLFHGLSLPFLSSAMTDESVDEVEDKED
jgi:hypothetical protein